MSFSRYDLAQDLDELGKMVKWLPDYLKGSELYGNIGGGLFVSGTAPKLTVGALLMRERRLTELRLSLTDSLQQRLQQARITHEQVRHNMAAQYTGKMERELGSRLSAMDRFFEECAESPDLCPRIYQPEVLRRTISEELYGVLNETHHVSDALESRRRRVDNRLRRTVKPAEFVWDDRLKPVYSERVYWWMYMAPPARTAR